jgi:subtilase family serine protease
MRSRLVSYALPVVSFLAVFTQQSYAATAQNRITSGISGSSRVAVEHTVPAPALRSSDLGPAPASRALSELSVRFNMTAAQQADLTQLMIAQQNPSSPSYHEWLTPEQYGARFGLSASDLATVSSWLTGQGFHVTGVARSSTFITFTGTVAQAQQAFGTSIHSLSLNGEQHISNVTDPVLPSAIGGVVTAITGLNDFRLKPRARTNVVKVNPNYTYTNSGVTSHYIAPGDFYKIYDVNPQLTGAGITIAVMGQTSLPSGNADTTAFRSTSGLPAYCIQTAPATTCASQSQPTLTLQPYGTNPPGVVSGDIDESNLDIEWAGASAQSANILFAYSTDVLNVSLTQAIDNNVAPIITNSYGLCESELGASSINTLNLLLQQANIQGITIVSAAGDGGATDCDTTGLSTEGLAVDFPASSPFVTAAGGTMFNEGSGSYWNSSNGTNAGSATGYIPEAPWNETNSSSGLTAGGAGGGGASAFFVKPAWQTGTGVPADGARDVPDFSLNSGAIHDGYIVCSQGSCTNGFLSSNGSINVFGGTSVAAPTFAGMLAMVEQKLGGGRLGNIGPNLYGIANSQYYNNVFHDITSGNNAVSCIAGTPNCPTGGPIGYNAGVGYDQATGLGSVDAANLAQYWALGTPTGSGSVTGATLSSTALTTSSVLCGISTGSVPLSVAVASAGSSTGGPTGTVQFFVDNVAVGTPVTLAGGTATYTLSTAGLSSGQHNVSAVYSGDATFSGSKGSLLSSAGIVAPIDVVSSTQPDFSITPCSASTTVTAGTAASPVVLTIAPFTGFQGSVNLSASSDSGVALGYAFSVKPVVINSSTAATTSFVLTATQTTTTGALKGLKFPSSHPPMGRTPWYAAGSGATLACLILLTVPRRRRWGALLALCVSVAAIGAAGCGSSSSTVVAGGGSNATPAPAGTYHITITATSGTLVHSTVLTYTVH